MHEHIQGNVYSPQQWRFSPLSKHILKNGPSKNYFSMNMNLDNYDSLADPREHMQNIRSSLDLIIQDHDSMCKIFLSTFKGSTRAWYNKTLLKVSVTYV